MATHGKEYRILTSPRVFGLSWITQSLVFSDAPSERKLSSRGSEISKHNVEVNYGIRSNLPVATRNICPLDDAQTGLSYAFEGVYACTLCLVLNHAI